MAYKKGKTSGARRAGSGYGTRKRTSTRTARSGAKRSGRAVQTLRIVVEQPQAVSSIVPTNTASGRKAQF